jgi:hypothetical protein
VLALVERCAEERDHLIGHQLVDGAVARHHRAGRDLIEVIQALDQVGGGQALGDLARAWQPEEGDRDRDLPARGRELISGRAQ